MCKPIRKTGNGLSNMKLKQVTTDLWIVRVKCLGSTFKCWWAQVIVEFMYLDRLVPTEVCAAAQV